MTPLWIPVNRSITAENITSVTEGPFVKRQRTYDDVINPVYINEISRCNARSLRLAA